MADYEQERQANILRNRQLLLQLGLDGQEEGGSPAGPGSSSSSGSASLPSGTGSGPNGAGRRGAASKILGNASSSKSKTRAPVSRVGYKSIAQRREERRAREEKELEGLKQEAEKIYEQELEEAKAQQAKMEVELQVKREKEEQEASAPGARRTSRRISSVQAKAESAADAKATSRPKPSKEERLAQILDSLTEAWRLEQQTLDANGVPLRRSGRARRDNPAGSKRGGAGLVSLPDDYEDDDENSVKRPRFQPLRKLRDPSPGYSRKRRRTDGGSADEDDGGAERPADPAGITWEPSLTPKLSKSEAERDPTTHPRPPRRAFDFGANYRHFRPNVSPAEMFVGGAFGGTGWRRHFSAVTRRWLDPAKELELPAAASSPSARDIEANGGESSALRARFLTDLLGPAWRKDTAFVQKKLTAETYDASVNRFGIKASQSLAEWEKAGWILAQDERGWFQWYLRFYYGRRSPDDERQMARWTKACGRAGRFRKSLAVKIANSTSRKWDDEMIAPTLRQTLWHWGYELTEQDYQAYL